jgi:hypothetical protein
MNSIYYKAYLDATAICAQLKHLGISEQSNKANRLFDRMIKVRKWIHARAIKNVRPHFGLIKAGLQ